MTTPMATAVAPAMRGHSLSHGFRLGCGRQRLCRQRGDVDGHGDGDKDSGGSSGAAGDAGNSDGDTAGVDAC